MSPIDAAIIDLEVMARDTFKAPEKAHWSHASAILGRISDEALYSTDYFGKYATLESYAKDLLELTKGEVGMALKLWRLIRRCDPPITFMQWEGVKRARALLLIEVLDAGADVRTWFAKMWESPTTLDFEMEVRFFLKEQVWTWFKVKVPLDLLGVIEEALVRAVETTKKDMILPVHMDQLPPELAQMPEYRFQCLEQIALHFLQTVEAPQLEIDEVTKAVTEKGM